MEELLIATVVLVIGIPICLGIDRVSKTIQANRTAEQQKKHIAGNGSLHGLCL